MPHCTALTDLQQDGNVSSSPTTMSDNPYAETIEELIVISKRLDRKVFLPPKSLERCHICAKTERLRLCASCGERIYCSRKCQRSDWPKHKLSCGPTDRIDLRGFYPYLAYLFEVGVNHKCRPIHPALKHKIINPINPETPPIPFPDGSEAKLVILGDEISYDKQGSPEWWPKAKSARLRSKLAMRILREGFLLPNYLSIAIAILREMYTTDTRTDLPTEYEKNRIRLQVHGQPVSDFGICKGETRAPARGRLAYLNRADGSITKGQDHTDHYWMYFTTIRGEEYVLDCGMYTFNLAAVVANSECYRYPSEVPTGCIPAIFNTKSASRFTRPEDYLIETGRFSVLYDKRLQKMVQEGSFTFSYRDAALMWEFMDQVAGRRCSDDERAFVMKLASENCLTLLMLLHSRKWAEWPKEAEPTLQYDYEAGEMVQDPEDIKFLKKQAKKVHRGKITREEMIDTFKDFVHKRGDDYF